MKNITLLLVSMLTIMSGTTIAPSLPDIASFFSTTPFIDLLAKLVLTMPALMIMLFAPFSNTLSLRFGRKKVLLTSLLLYAFSGVGGMFADNIYLLIFTRALLGVSVGFIMSINISLIADYFEGEARTNFLAKQGFFVASGGVLFLVGGGYLSEFSWRAPFGIYAFSLFVFVVVYFFIQEPKQESLKESSEEKEVHFHKHLPLAYLATFVTMVLFYVVPSQLPFLLEHELGLHGVQIGLGVAVTPLCNALGSLSYKKLGKRLSITQAYTLAAFCMGLGFANIFFVQSFLHVVFSAALFGFGMGIAMVTNQVWSLSLSTAKNRLIVSGRMTAFTFMGQFLSPILTLIPLMFTNLRGLFLLTAVILWLIGLGLFFIKPSRTQRV